MRASPYLLWTRGAVSFLTTALSDRATITGARAATAYGAQVAGELATGLPDEKRVVVFGGAYGIEGAAHKSVLAASGQTIAVLAGGLDRPYPSGHSDLMSQIGDVGLLLRELPPGDQAQAIAPLGRVLNEAVRDGLLTINPAKNRAKRSLNRNAFRGESAEQPSCGRMRSRT